MPRCLRFCPKGIPVHVIQRGNNRRPLFTSDKDIATYANWLVEGAAKYGLSVHGWVFMTNHVHLLITPTQNDSVSKMMQHLGRLYVRYFNTSYARTGTLFEGRFRSSIVDKEEYLLACLRYIELNPVRAGMVSDPGDYMWSSYRAHSFGVEARLWSPHSAYRSLGKNAKERQKAYRGLLNETLDPGVTTKIRHCANRGLVLGSEKFREQIAEMTG